MILIQGPYASIFRVTYSGQRKKTLILFCLTEIKEENLNITDLWGDPKKFKNCNNTNMYAVCNM